MIYKLYSALKDTREGKDNLPLKEEYANRIKSKISLEEIEKMSGNEVKEAVIDYLKSIFNMEDI